MPELTSADPFCPELADRLMRYAAIDSQSDDDSPTAPSTAIQMDMQHLLLRELAEIGAKDGKSAAQTVIRWHIQRGVVVLPKSTHADRIRQNIDVFDFVLSDDDMAAISAMDTGKRNSADPDNFDF